MRDLAEMPFADAKAFETWLRRNYDKSPGIWMRIAKKDSGIESVNYSDALDVSLCYGWIDGQKQKGDDDTWLQKFTPRAKRSIWSQLNRQRVARLIESKRMKAPGLAEVERAKADGRWERAYESPKDATMHPDLEAALNRNPKAQAFFATVNKANRYAILWRVQTAKRPETRAKRIAEYVDMLARGKTIH
jgi:uncharacterized protein YdeI (YjbR/CyaY-like superfamily)